MEKKLVTHCKDESVEEVVQSILEEFFDEEEESSRIEE